MSKKRQEKTEPYKIKQHTKSVCKWNLSFKFKEEYQCREFIKKLLVISTEGGWNSIPSFSFTHDPEITYDQYPYEIILEEWSWAHNLVQIAQLLEEVDHDSI